MRNCPLDCLTVTSSDMLRTLYRLLSEHAMPPAEHTDERAHAAPAVAASPQRPQSAMADGQAWLNIPLLVVSQRQAQDAKHLGFKHIMISPGADNQTLVQTLNQWRATKLDQAP